MAPIKAPIIWPAIYIGTLAQVSLPSAAMASVTAGFRCPPLIHPTEYTATATPSPHPAVITIQPLFWPLDLLSRTFATTPSPSTTSNMVPIISAVNGLIGLYVPGLARRYDERAAH